MDLTQPYDHGEPPIYIHAGTPAQAGQRRAATLKARNLFCRRPANVRVAKQPVDTLGLMLDIKAITGMLITAQRQLRQARQPGGSADDAIIAQQNLNLLRDQLTTKVNSLNFACDSGLEDKR